MTNKELREHLSKYPDDTLVVIPGYVLGYESVNASGIDFRDIILDAREDSYFGTHEDPEHWLLRESKKVVKAIVIK